MPTTSRRQRAKTVRPFRPRLESMETRVVLSTVSILGDVLTITGTAASDRIQIGAAGADQVRVMIDGRNLGRFGPVARIAIDAGAGDDLVALGRGVRLPAVIHGGDGDDMLRGGSGADQVFGDAGDDALIGTTARDALSGGQGANRLQVPQSMGTIAVGPSASGDVLRVLSKGYSLRRPGQAVGPMIVGAADLDDANLAGLLKQSYEAGETVALTNASVEDASQLAQLVGHEGGVDWDESTPNAALLTLRKTVRPDGGLNFLTEFHAPRIQNAPGAGAGVGAAAGRNRADQSALLIYSHSFAGTPVAPTPPGDNPETNLINLSNSYQSKSYASDEMSNAIQVLNSVWSARSFQNQVDLYYVLQEFDVEYGGVSKIPSWSNYVSSLQRFHPALLLQPSPESSQEAVTETSSVSYTVGGSAGWNSASGVNATVSGSVTITNSKSVTIPPVQIQNTSDLSTAWGNWAYLVNDLPSRGYSEALTFYNSWIWSVPFSSYNGMTSLPYTTTGNLFLGELGSGTSVGLPPINVSIPLPFGDVFSLQAPKVTGLSATEVEEGTSFKIQGTGLYPSLVTGVLIGGKPLTSEQFTTVSDTEIEVIAPFWALDSAVVVQTTQGTSNDDFTITIY